MRCVYDINEPIFIPVYLVVVIAFSLSLDYKTLKIKKNVLFKLYLLYLPAVYAKEIEVKREASSLNWLKRWNFSENDGANHQEWGAVSTQALHQVPLHSPQKVASLCVGPDFWNTI